MPDPEALARIDIDRQLEAAGWIVQDRDTLNIFAGPGVAEREVSFPGAGKADSLLIADTSRTVEPNPTRPPLSSPAPGKRSHRLERGTENVARSHAIRPSMFDDPNRTK